MTLSKKMRAETHNIADQFKKGGITNTKALKLIHELVYRGKPSDRTITIRFSLIKRIFKDYTSEKLFLKKIKPEDNITRKVIKINDETRDQQKIQELDEQTIKQIMSYGGSGDVYKIFIFLLFVSGRRTYELINSQFTNTLRKKGNLIKMTGISKTRGNDSNECYFSPLIRKGTFFRIYHRFFRLIHLNSLNTFQRQLSYKINSLFPGKGYHPHSFRGMYAIYMYKFRNPDKKKINTFIQDVLCHQTVKSSMSYTQWDLNNVNTDILKKITF